PPVSASPSSVLFPSERRPHDVYREDTGKNAQIALIPGFDGLAPSQLRQGIASAPVTKFPHPEQGIISA
ncbi:MAG: hypothetical protein ACOYM5_12215, partial [Caulobacter sp.]